MSPTLFRSACSDSNKKRLCDNVNVCASFVTMLMCVRVVWNCATVPLCDDLWADLLRWAFFSVRIVQAALRLVLITTLQERKWVYWQITELQCLRLPLRIFFPYFVFLLINVYWGLVVKQNSAMYPFKIAFTKTHGNYFNSRQFTNNIFFHSRNRGIPFEC